jgi:hypothetical protein
LPVILLYSCVKGYDKRHEHRKGFVRIDSYGAFQGTFIGDEMTVLPIDKIAKGSAGERTGMVDGAASILIVVERAFPVK